MKIEQLATVLKEITERLPIVLVDEKEGKEYPVIKNEYHRDGGGWCEFGLVIDIESTKEDRMNQMDSDWLKHILDYELNNPEYKPSFFSGEEPFGNYVVKINGPLIFSETGCSNQCYGRISSFQYKAENGVLKFYIEEEN